MKNWSTTKKILVALAVLIILALIVTGINSYFSDKKATDATRVQNRISQAVQDQKSTDDITGDKFMASIRENLAKQPVSEIGVKFYQP